MEITRKFKDHQLAEIRVETPDTTTTTLHFDQGKLKKLFIWGKDGNSVSAVFDEDHVYSSAEGNPGAFTNYGILGLNLAAKTSQNQFQPVCQLIIEDGHFAGLKMLQGIRGEDKSTQFVPMASISLNGEITKEKDYERRVSCKDTYSYTNPMYWRRVKGSTK